jgi:hypothetical protein
VVVEAGVIAGYIVAWAVRKARRAAGRLDAEVDTAIDAGLDRLHAAVADRLGAHPVLGELTEEASDESGQVSDLTRQQLELAVTAAAPRDDEFGETVTDLLARVRAAEQAAGASVVAGPGSVVFTGDATATASGGGIAFGQVAGDVSMGAPSRGEPDPRRPGR